MTMTNCKQVRYERDPDVVGPRGAAWLAAPIVGGPPDWQAALGTYIVYAPDYNIAWAWWAICACHLRPIDGVRPAVLQFPGAEHELMIAALDPGHPLPDVDGRADGHRLHVLTPIDLAYQCSYLTDDQMRRMLLTAVRAVLDGRMSPDQDYRQIWRTALDATAAQYRAGAHEAH